MNKAELFKAVKSWLEAEEINFSSDVQEAEFNFRMHMENVATHVRLICEESPSLVQILCSIPVKVADEKLTSTALLLHNLNVNLRMGAYYLAAEEHAVTFRLPLQIQNEAELPEQCRFGLGTVLNTVDDHFQSIAVHIASTPKALQRLAKLHALPAFPMNETCEKADRFQLN